MGCIYRPRYKAADGTLRASSVWWLKYRGNGREIRESSGTDNREEAKRSLKRKEGASAEGKPVFPHADKIKLAELAEDLKNNYIANEMRSLDRMEDAINHLLPFFGHLRATQLTSADVTKYITTRQEEKAANGTINRELAALKRMFSLAVKAEKLYRIPHIPRLEERNVGQGFFEREQFEAVRSFLPDYVKPIVTFAYITGWRIRSEVLNLHWRQVDFKAGTVRLEPETTKNRDGRTFFMTPELRACLEAQKAATEAFQRKTKQILPWVFHREGERIKGFRRAWVSACRKAGVPGRIPHDFRRTAVRNLERAGVPRSTAMKMVGHRTESIYRRYAIVDEAMLREGSEKLAQAQPWQAK